MKKLILLYFSGFLCLSAVISCKKDPSPETVTSLTIVNALPGNRLMIADFSGKPANQFVGEGLTLYYGLYDPSSRLSLPKRDQPLTFYKYPFVAGDQPLYNLNLNTKPGEINTLFLTGTKSQPEHFVINEKPPYYSVKDSLVGLRFVNLSAGSGPMQVKISGEGLSTGISNNDLVYKGITGYLPIPATSRVGDLLVEFYDQASGKLLAALTLEKVGATLTDNPYRYRNYTLALIGLPDASEPADAQRVLKINDY
jgi:hypothetical protein